MSTLIWSLSGTISYLDNTWRTFSVCSDNSGFSTVGPDISAYPEIVALLTSLGLPTRDSVADTSVKRTTFRLNILDTESDGRVLVTGGNDQISVQSANQAIIDKLVADHNYISMFSPDYGMPVIVTGDVTTDFMGRAFVAATITSDGGSAITDRGVVLSTSDTIPTLSDRVVTNGSGTGAFTTTVSGLDPMLTYFRPYATNANGTVYGDVVSATPELCLLAGTSISMADGSQKAIEDVGYDDELLVWDFDNGEFASAKPVWIMNATTPRQRHNLVRFSDGSELRTAAPGIGHRIFNIDKGMFTYSMTDDTPLGTKTFNIDGEIVTLISKDIIEEESVFYNIITDQHLNIFANSILTSTQLNNIYPIADMQFQKSERAKRSRNEFKVSDDLYYGLRLAEQPGSNNLQHKLDKMIEHQASRQELAHIQSN